MRVKIISGNIDEQTTKILQEKVNELVAREYSPYAIMYYIIEEWNYSTCVIIREKDIIYLKVFKK